MSQAARTEAVDNEMYRLLVQGVTDYAIYMLDPAGRVSNWNAGAERAKGYSAEEIIGTHFSVFHTPEDRHRGLPQRALATAMSQGKFEGEGWRLRRDGSRFWAHVVIDLLRGETGDVIGFAKITRDLTERKRQDDLLKQAAINCELALSNMSQGLCLFDANERLVLCNTRLYELMSLDKAAFGVGSTYTDLLWELQADSTAGYHERAEDIARDREAHLARIAEAHGTVVSEISRRGRDIQVSHRPLAGGGWVSTMDDVTERRRIEDQIIHLANHDTLTELPNRARFREEVERALIAPAPMALLCIDLDRFKPVNDTLGHPVGDAVLRAVAERIRLHLREEDVLARLGGDEFAVLLPACSEAEDAGRIAQRLIAEIGRPIRVNGMQVVVGASIGIAFPPAEGDGPNLWLRNADLALYRAKENGRGCCRFYEPGMERVIQQRRELERDLREALVQDQFSLHYQPVVNGACSSIRGFEALLRWDSPTRGRVPPLDFIPFAEEIGLMVDIGDWVLRTACRQAVLWPADLKVSVNLSATQFKLSNLADRISAALTETGLDAGRLELEITETAMIDDVVHATETLLRLRGLGIEIALDDFGTGYSSLSFLRSLPITRIKIDRSFVKDLGIRPEAAAIVRAVSGMCGSLGVSVTAEGVETAQQADFLRAEGCPEMQGFLIGRPFPSADLDHWIAAFPAKQGGKHDAARAPALAIA